MVPTGASDEILRLRTELAAARQHAGDAEQKALEKEAENARIKAANADLRARNAHLELMNELMRRDKFGASSERRRRLIDQMELELEDLEADATEAEMEAAYAAAKTTTVKAFTRARSTRRDFHPDLPRERVVLAAPTECPCCGSDKLSHLPPVITEAVEKIPARIKVIQTVREKVSCRQCEKISQQPAPFHVTPRGMFGPHFLADLAFNKFGLHQPLNAQRDRLESQGLSLSLSTLADQIGAICVAVKPVFAALEAYTLSGGRLHGDDTTVPLLARFKTEVARVWFYVRDDSPFGGADPPAVVGYYSRDRKGEHPQRHLAGYTGILQVDRYAGFNELFKDGWSGQPMTRANCWAHGRREFFKLVDVAGQLKRKNGKKPVISPLAMDALERIDRIFDVEREINGKIANERLAARQERVAPLVSEFESWMREQRAQLSRHDAVAKAISYFFNDWPGFTNFLSDGRICLTNNCAERQVRGIARGRKAWLFVGSDRGGERAAMLYSLIQTCRLNDVDPLVWLTDVLTRIAELPQGRVHELLPWEWKKLRDQATLAQAA